MTATEARIVEAFEGLSPAHQRIARVVLDDRVAAALCSADALGRRADTNAATIVRFAQALGYRGWAELRETLRGEVPNLVTALERLDAPAARIGAGPGVDAAVVAQDVHNVQETARLNPPEALQAATDALTSARRVLVVGLGIEAPLAEILAVALGRAGLDSRRLGDPGLSATTLELAATAPGDAVVGIAVWRYIADTSRLFDAAVAAGATGIAVTDNRVAPVTRQAHTVLLASDGAPLLSQSMTGMLSLLNVLASRVVAAGAEDARRRLERLDGLFGELGVIDG
ncbi:MurR/RpiR family transcriptional regulator [Baekduia soli]|uniref:MurR/RpiR family transcriptional regulator n=1 Tax=Baekduia soli TaxID=496014 RepID=A0A5B8U672_9ACTN|nr:MurR/RpiR family transcriptional regulator [Baekduia soli]QEC48431.1 MurR/RpiR family transcriptional regulator [Baekduia soli]